MVACLGDAEQGLADLAEAVPVLRAASQLGDLATALYHRGQILAEWKGEPARALRCFRAASQPGIERTIVHTLARALRDRRRFAEARGVAQELRRLEVGRRDHWKLS